MTQALSIDWLVYGTFFALLAVFMFGLLQRSRRRSMLLGNIGLLALLIIGAYVVLALTLPMISLVNSLT